MIHPHDNPPSLPYNAKLALESLMNVPYLTADLPGIGGLIKQHTEDFVVHEIPLYAPDGVGTHAYARIEKRGITTMEAAKLLARALGRKNFDIGYAGLKDARAVATQWFSVEHEDSARLRSLEVPHLKILEVTRHRNKIKMGHLAGNRFVIKVRNPEWSRIAADLPAAQRKAQAVWDALDLHGVPNFFGPQRFGMRKDNHLLGLALIRNDFQSFADRFLGDPDPTVDHGDVLTARQLYKNGKLDDALKLWPGHLHNERRALSALIKGTRREPLFESEPQSRGLGRTKGNPKRAIYAVDIKLKQLLVSALQSHLFNQVLERRLPKFAVILPGDLCWKHDNGACFAVGPDPDSAMKEQPRADAREISPSGPLFGWKMTETQSLVKTMEDAVLLDNQLTLNDFAGPAGSHGGRRSLRFFPQDMKISSGADPHGPYLQFDFSLTSGSYATIVLAEIMKSEAALD